MRFPLLVSSLVQNFTHIGFHKAAANHAYRFYLLGHHSNVSIINPCLTLASTRKAALIVLRFLVRRHKMCFITDKFLPYDGRKLFFNQHYCLNYWVPGTLSNRRYSVAYGQKNFRIHLRGRVPAVIVTIGLPQKKTYEIYKEARSRHSLFLTLLDSDTEPSIYSYFIPTNTKSPSAVYFFLDLFSQLCTFSRLLIKRRFFSYVLKKKKI